MQTALKTTGLRYWMLQVLEECGHVAADFSADPVHDLRVSLRRCRSVADGVMAIDPDPDWKAMRKAGKKLFQRLGALRDVQIMMEWIEKLHPKVVPELLAGMPETGDVEGDQSGTAAGQSSGIGAGHNFGLDRAAQGLVQILKERESNEKKESRTALGEFDQREWRRWAKTLPQRATHIRPGSAVYKHLALERWTAARELHVRAVRNRSQVAFHTLRIGIKRFRYIVENFLPVEHKAWSGDLKHMQDLLGEVHDLDVLWATALSCRVFPDENSRQRWHERILEERTKRIDEYRERTAGPNSLWNVWRAGLPQGKQIAQIATQRIKLWARVLDPDFAHSERIARLALELYDGLEKTGLFGSAAGANGDGTDARASLYAAALLHDVGKSKSDKGHHKESLELIQKHGTPLGWDEQGMRRAAVVARFHAGALPTRSHKHLRDLLPDEQKTVIRLSAILRLANALDSAHDGHVRRVKVEDPEGSSKSRGRTKGLPRKAMTLGKNEALVLEAEGYTDGNPTAQRVAAERYLLETVLRRPVVVRAMR